MREVLKHLFTTQAYPLISLKISSKATAMQVPLIGAFTFTPTAAQMPTFGIT